MQILRTVIFVYERQQKEKKNKKLWANTPKGYQ